MILAGTGHRPHKLFGEYDGEGPCSQYLRIETRKLLQELHPTQVISGMALGFDQILAKVSIEMKIPVLAAIPFLGQETVWSSKQQEIYQRILKNPLVETKIVCSGSYSRHKLLVRDKWMINQCDAVIACWNGITSGGTYYTVSYAQKLGKPIYRIIPQIVS